MEGQLLLGPLPSSSTAYQYISTITVTSRKANCVQEKPALPYQIDDAIFPGFHLHAHLQVFLRGVVIPVGIREGHGRRCRHVDAIFEADHRGLLDMMHYPLVIAILLRFD